MSTEDGPEHSFEPLIAEFERNGGGILTMADLPSAQVRVKGRRPPPIR